MFIMLSVYGLSQNWNEPNYNPYYFGTVSVHVSDTLSGWEGYVGLHDSIDFYKVQLGDWIGYFDSVGLCCGSNQIITFEYNLGISIVGDDLSTDWKEGFYEGEKMYQRIYSFSLRQDFPCGFVSYMTPEEDSTILPEFYCWIDYFQNTKLYVVDSLTAYVPLKKFCITLSEGWGGISSPYIPVIRDVEVMFEGTPLVCLINGSQSYMPGYHNTIDLWQPDKGYHINVSEDCIIEITGFEIMNKTLELQAGWHIIPVLSNEPVVCNFDISGESDLIQDFSVNFYWPYEGIYEIDYLIPGKAYKVHLGSPFMFNFELDYFIGFPVIRKEKKTKRAVLHNGKMFFNGFDLNGKRYE